MVPTGARVAFSSTVGGNQDIYVADPSGAGLTRLTSDAAADSSPTWSATGARIAYIRTGAQAGVWVMNADGTGQSLLRPGVSGVLTDPQWSSGGDWIAYLDVGCSTGVKAVRLVRSNNTGPDYKVACGGALTDSHLSWSPLGGWLTVSQSGSVGGRYVSRIATVDAVNRRTTIVAAGLGRAVRSPDGMQLAATAGNAGVDVVGAGGLDARRVLATPTSPALALAWQPDPCTISGGAGANSLSGTSGKDVVCGLAGNDVIHASAGIDVYSGGTGIDMLDLARLSRSAAAWLPDVLTSGSGRAILSGFENVVGSPYGDSLVGGAAANLIEGGPGNDHLRGGAGADELLGGPGNDVIDARDGRGGDHVNGGDGSDVCLADRGDAVLNCQPPLSKLHPRLVPWLTLGQLSSCFAAPSPPSRWPLINEFVTHPVRSGFNDPRGTMAHFGVDIEAPDQAPAYAMLGGTILGDIRRGTWDEAFRVGPYVYYHVNLPASLGDGSYVTAGQELGRIHQGMRHVHVSEIEGACGLVDPRRPSGPLRDPRDVEHPTIGPLTAFVANSTAYEPFPYGPGPPRHDPSTPLRLDALHGVVDFRSLVEDIPTHRTTYAPQQPLMVSGVRSYLAPVGHPFDAVGPALVALRGASVIPPGDVFHVLARGTRYVAMCEYLNTRPCLIRLVLHVAGLGVNTRAVPNGDYMYCVTAVTIGNRAAEHCTPVTILNFGSASASTAPVTALTPLGPPAPAATRLPGADTRYREPGLRASARPLIAGNQELP